MVRWQTESLAMVRCAMRQTGEIIGVKWGRDAGVRDAMEG